MMLESSYSLGQYVYLVTDSEQEKRLITAITIRQTGVIYELSCGTTTSNHYDFEISENEDATIKIH